MKHTLLFVKSPPDIPNFFVFMYDLPPPPVWPVPASCPPHGVGISVADLADVSCSSRRQHPIRVVPAVARQERLLLTSAGECVPRSFVDLLSCWSFNGGNQCAVIRSAIIHRFMPKTLIIVKGLSVVVVVEIDFHTVE